MPPEHRPPVEAQHLDAMLPQEIARTAEEVGVRKANLDLVSLFTLAVLAGAFIALGAIFSTTVAAGAQDLPFGVVRLLAGTVFSLGLILVVVGGAELFTGNAIIVMAWAARRIPTLRLVRNWVVVLVGNLVGGVGTAVLNFAAGQYKMGGGAVGESALKSAEAKCALPFGEALALGVLSNTLVCLAVWLCLGTRRTSGRILAIVFPIAAFVASGFEHSIANMYFIPVGLLVKYFGAPSFWQASGLAPADFPSLTLEGLVLNLVPVTIGNVIGGGVLVSLVYWFVYLRRR
jgi:formate/nitrite transporter